MSEPDKQWFLDQLHAKRESMRSMARAVQLDVSSVSRLLSGKRLLQIDEAAKIAAFLGVDTVEVMRRAVPQMVRPKPDGFSKTGEIDQHGFVTKIKAEPLPLSVAAKIIAVINASQGRIKDASAAEIVASNSVIDGATVLYAKPVTIDDLAIGLPAIVRLNDKRDIFCRLLRIRKSGEADLLLPDGKSLRAIATAASPVHAIIP